MRVKELLIVFLGENRVNMTVNNMEKWFDITTEQSSAKGKL